MREELSSLVNVKVKPVRRPSGLSVKHAVNGYPTVILLRPDGREVGRIVGFKPPKEFLGLVREMRHGRPLDDLVAKLRGPDRVHDELPGAMDGLRERGDFLTALELLRQVHREVQLGCCRGEEWRTELELQARLFRDTGAWATGQREAPPEVPGERSVTMLASLLAAGPVRDDVDGLRRFLREARRVETALLGAEAPVNDLSPEALSRSANLLYDGGDYDGAGRLWRRAVEDGVEWNAGYYYAAARRLLDAETYLQTAEEWARRAVRMAGSGGQPGLMEKVLLARIQAKLGKKEEAVATARRAAKKAIEWRQLAFAHEASQVARRCEEGRPEVRREPAFERWPR